MLIYIYNLLANKDEHVETVNVPSIQNIDQVVERFCKIVQRFILISKLNTKKRAPKLCHKIHQIQYIFYANNNLRLNKNLILCLLCFLMLYSCVIVFRSMVKITNSISTKLFLGSSLGVVGCNSFFLIFFFLFFNHKNSKRNTE